VLTEIKSKYHEFGDALVSKIVFDVTGYGTKNIRRNSTVKLTAYNWQAEKREVIALSFIDIVKFRFSESKKISSTVILEAYLAQTDDLIIFDFFALQVGQNDVAEDPNSDFVIHCREIKYEVIDLNFI
jgi:hypothetical protein